jgi:thioredoxin 1
MSVVVKKFGADWCGPCRALKPVLESIVKEFEGKITYMEYNVDNSPEETQKYTITSIPVVIIEKDGQLIERFTGLSSKIAYSNAINEALK